MNLAELNISRWKIEPGSDAAMGFVRNVARVNRVAEEAPGFVWRLKDEQRDANGRNAVVDGDDMIMTLSTWESAEDLENFVWKTVHKRIYNDKHQWFGEMQSHNLVMWWVDEGHQPEIEEARERLDFLDDNGNSDFAFDWGHLPHVKLWQEKQCG